MEKIALITDSTVYLPDEYLKEKKIHVVSLNVIEGEKSHKELEIDNDFIFERLNNKIKLTTSQPSPNEFVEAYEEAFKKGYEHIFVLTLSKGLSGTYQSAVLARNMLDKKDEITIFDTNQAAYGNELLLEKLVDLIKQEKEDVEKIKKRFYEIIENTYLYFTVENLFNLYKGGRLSKTSAVIGTVLRVKPVIKMTDGKLKLAHKERTNKKLYAYFIDQIKSDPHYAEEKTLNVRIIERNSEANANELKQNIEDNFKKTKLVITSKLGPVFSIHIGDKGYGLAWFFE